MRKIFKLRIVMKSASNIVELGFLWTCEVGDMKAVIFILKLFEFVVLFMANEIPDSRIQAKWNLAETMNVGLSLNVMCV